MTKSAPIGAAPAAAACPPPWRMNVAAVTKDIKKNDQRAMAVKGTTRRFVAPATSIAKAAPAHRGSKEQLDKVGKGKGKASKSKDIKPLKGKGKSKGSAGDGKGRGKCKDGKGAQRRGRGKGTYSKGKGKGPATGCFKCGGPH